MTLARAELCVLATDKETQDSLEGTAGKQVAHLWAEHHTARLGLTPQRQAAYARVNRMAASPEPEDLKLPDKVTVPGGQRYWTHHVYADDAAVFHPSPLLNRWEEVTLRTEMSRRGFRGWLRNPVRKDWSLGIPYEAAGLPSVMYPDFVIIRTVGKQGLICDLLEPHASNQSDLIPKLHGLRRYAEHHGHKYGRICVVLVEGPRGREKLMYIDLNNPEVRNKARLLSDGAQAVALARELSH